MRFVPLRDQNNAEMAIGNENVAAPSVKVQLIQGGIQVESEVSIPARVLQRVQPAGQAAQTRSCPSDTRTSQTGLGPYRKSRSAETRRKPPSTRPCCSRRSISERLCNALTKFTEEAAQLIPNAPKQLKPFFFGACKRRGVYKIVM
jgi:hypothetical protein